MHRRRESHRFRCVCVCRCRGNFSVDCCCFILDHADRMFMTYQLTGICTHMKRAHKNTRRKNSRHWGRYLKDHGLEAHRSAKLTMFAELDVRLRCRAKMASIAWSGWQCGAGLSRSTFGVCRVGGSHTADRCCCSSWLVVAVVLCALRAKMGC